jgi:hypothetical protein
LQVTPDLLECSCGRSKKPIRALVLVGSPTRYFPPASRQFACGRAEPRSEEPRVAIPQQRSEEMALNALFTIIRMKMNTFAQYRPPV